MSDKKITIVINGKDNSAGAFSKVRGNLQKTEKAVNSLSTKMLSIGKSARDMGKKFTLFATVPIVAFGIKAVSSLIKFNKAMSDINTLFDDNGQSINIMKKGITEMLKHSPKNADDLGASAYAIVSAGITNASSALKVLNSSQKLAVAGLGTTAQATDIVTSAINSFGISAGKSNDIANVFFLGVKGGKTTVADLAQGFGRVAPIASKMGVSLKSLVATVSAMTTSGMKAEDAYVQVKALLSSMLKPTAQMSDAMKKVGLNSNNLAKTIGKEGLVKVLQELSGSVGGNKSQLAQMFGNVRGLNGVMMLLGGTGKKTSDILKGMTQDTNALNVAFKKQLQTTDSQWKIMKNNLNIAMRDLATIILPPLIKAIKKLTTFFSGLTSGQKKVIVVVLGLVAVIGPLIFIIGTLITIITTVAGIIAGITATIGIVIAVIVGLIAIGVLLYKNWGTIQKKGQEFWTFLKKVWGDGTDWMKKQINSLIGFFDNLINKISQAINWIKKYSGYNAVSGAIKKVGGAVGSAFGGHRALGGSVSLGNSYVVGERGPELFTPSSSGNITPNNSLGSNINIYISGNTLLDRRAGEKIGDQIIKKLKLVTAI